MDDMRAFNQALIEEYRASGGKLSGRLANSTILLLSTIGARSGKAHTVPLGHGKDGDRLVVIAANAGAPAHPDWYYNLLAHPIVEVELGGERFQARATIAAGAERERLIEHEIVPFFAAQQAKTSREIPLVALERIAPHGAHADRGGTDRNGDDSR